jgi:CubicO group peptidase (beta-lactamase class C family)
LNQFIILFFLFSSNVFSNSLQKKLEAFHETTDFPAFGLAVIEGEEVQYATSGVRRVSEQEKVSINDKWHIGSMTKSMTSALVAILIDKNYLTWNTTLKDVFPELEINSAFANLPITRFLTHSSGINDEDIMKDYVLLFTAFAPGNTPQQTRNILAKLILKKESSLPQSQFRYSNFAFAIVGAAIEKLTSKDWETLLIENLFNPLEMNSCGFGPTTLNNSSPADQPWGHRRNTQGDIFEIIPGPNADNPRGIGPAGIVHCSLPDLVLHLKSFS